MKEKVNKFVIESDGEDSLKKMKKKVLHRMVSVMQEKYELHAYGKR